MMRNMPDRIAYRFGDFLVEPATSQFWCAGVRQEIDPDALRLLAFLIEHADSSFTSAELRSKLWPSANFLDGQRNLDGAAARLREALDDSLTAPRFLSRLDGGGYRFVHPVRAGMNEPDLALASSGATMTPMSLTPPAIAPRRWRRFMLLVVVVQLAVFGLMFYLFRMLMIQFR
jgi:DNA-binding winged helix-turn-helix (wHTH) protein